MLQDTAAAAAMALEAVWEVQWGSEGSGSHSSVHACSHNNSG